MEEALIDSDEGYEAPALEDVFETRPEGFGEGEDDVDLDFDEEDEDPPPAAAKAAPKDEKVEKAEEQEKPAEAKEPEEAPDVEKIREEATLYAAQVKELESHVTDLAAENARLAKDVESANERVKGVGEAALALLSNPEKLDAYMEQHKPEQWKQAVQLAVNRLLWLEKAPENERLEYYRKRDRQTWEGQLQHERKRRESIEQAQAATAHRKAAVNKLRGPLTRARAELGNPNLQTEEGNAFWRESMRRLDIETQVGGQELTEEQVEQVFKYCLYKHFGDNAPNVSPERPSAPPRSSARETDGSGSKRSGDWIFKF